MAEFRQRCFGSPYTAATIRVAQSVWRTVTCYYPAYPAYPVFVYQLLYFCLPLLILVYLSSGCFLRYENLMMSAYVSGVDRRDSCVGYSGVIVAWHRSEKKLRDIASPLRGGTNIILEIHKQQALVMNLSFFLSKSFILIFPSGRL